MINISMFTVQGESDPKFKVTKGERSNRKAEMLSSYPALSDLFWAISKGPSKEPVLSAKAASQCL